MDSNRVNRQGGQKTSPLRQRSRSPMDSMEADELKRQEELRKQIALKEQQLQKMRQNTYSLKMKLTGREEERKEPIRDNYIRPERERQSPLRKMVESHSTGNRFSVNQFRVENSDRSKSPIQQSSMMVEERYLQPERSDSNPTFRLSAQKIEEHPPQERPDRQRPDHSPPTRHNISSYSRGSHPVQKPEFSTKLRMERAQTLKIDTDSLRRRLAIVQTEIDRVTRELATAKEKYETLAQRNNITQKQIIQEEPIDIENRELENQLHPLKAENFNLSKQVDIETLNTKQTHDQISIHQSTSLQVKSLNESLAAELAQKSAQFHQVDLNLLELIHNCASHETALKDSSLDFENIERENRALLDSVRQMQEMRSEELKRLEIGTIEFNKTKQEMGAKRSLMVRMHVRESRALGIKIFQNSIDACVYKRKLVTFKEINLYSKFDKKCHTCLRKLANVWYKQGKFIKMQAMDQWYENALKPKKVYVQNENLVARYRETKLKKFAYHSLFTFARHSQSIYSIKNKSIASILYITQRNTKTELKRYMNIWKQLLALDSKKYRNLYFILANIEKQYKKQSFIRWAQRSQQLELACRYELLKREYVHSMYQTSVHSNLRCATLDQKKMRILKQGQFFKAWRDYIERKRFDFSANVISLRILNTNEQYVLQMCFNAIKHEKVRQKLEIMGKALQGDMNKKLIGANAFLHERSVQLQKKYKRQSLEVVRTQLSKYLFCYFDHWKQVNKLYRGQINTKLRDRVIFRYKRFMSSYFFWWKKQKDSKKQNLKQELCRKIETANDEYYKVSIMQDTILREKISALSTCQRKTLARCLKKLQYRKQKLAIEKWMREYVNISRSKEHKAFIILQKIRKNIVKQMFQRYKYNAFFIRKVEIQNIRTDNLIWRFEKRTMNRMLQSWCAFTHNSKLSKKGLHRIMTRLFHKKMLRHYKRWSVNAKLKSVFLLNEEQNRATKKVVIKNQVLGEFIEIDEFQKTEVVNLYQIAKNKAKKVMYNYYQRNYTDGCKCAFRRWRVVYFLQKQKDKVILRMVQHYKKKIFDQVKSMFLKNAYRERSISMRQIIVDLKHQNAEINQTIVHNVDVFEDSAEILIYRMDKKNKNVVRQTNIRKEKQDMIIAQKQFENKSLIDFYSKRLNTTVGILIDRQDRLFIKSKKRAVWENWRRIAIIQRKFTALMARVVERSYYDLGFNGIRNAYKRKRWSYIIKRVIGRSYNRIYSYRLAESLSLWKAHAAIEACKDYNASKNGYQLLVTNFEQKIVNCKDQNTTVCEQVFRQKRKLKLWKAWQAVRYRIYIKAKLAKESLEVLASIKQKRSLQKWYHRTKETQRFRIKWAQFKQRHIFRMKQAVFSVFQFKKSVNNTMAITLSNFERFMRTKMMDDAFKDVKSFAWSKKLATNILKRRATFDVYSWLCQRHEKVMRRKFCQYRFQVFNDKQRKARAKIIFGKINAQRRHRAMRKWREVIENEIQVQELNETGPITEHVFEARRLMRNLLEFMKSEGYTPEQIKELKEFVNEQELAKINKGICRWKSLSDPNVKLAMKALDHWKMIIAFRKVMRHWLIFSNNRVQWVKADMQEAFGKWRMGDIKLSESFNSKPREFLVRRNLKQSNTLMTLAQDEAESDAVLKHLSLQRDELLEHYVRAQKLGLSLCMNNHTKGKGKYLRVWQNYKKVLDRDDKQSEVIQAVEELTIVKEKARKIERENQTLATENEELRQFSMDGFKIAQNVSSLSAEREKLTCDLADQAQMIKQLLEENRRLQFQLDQVMSGNQENMKPHQVQMIQSRGTVSIRKHKFDNNYSIKNNM